MIAEELWDEFIRQLNEERPLGKLGEHKAFLGSIEAYRAIFMRANEEHTIAGAFHQLLQEIEDEAMVLIAGCNTEAEINDVKSMLLGKTSFLKQLESALWNKR